jgi:hypothetical protein
MENSSMFSASGERIRNRIILGPRAVLFSMSASRVAVRLFRARVVCQVRVFSVSRIGWKASSNLHTVTVACRVGDHGRLAVPRVLRMSTSSAGTAGTSSQTEKDGRSDESREHTAGEEQQAEDESYYANDEPLALRISRGIWFGLQLLLGVGILSIVSFAGYSIVVTLIPSGVSPNAIMRKASVKLRADPEVRQQRLSCLALR